MNGSVAFVAIKRGMDFIVEANLDAVGFRGLHCKDYFSHKWLPLINAICGLLVNRSCGMP